MNDISKRIETAREAKGMNQSELARALGLTPQAVQKWEAGGAPRGTRLQQVADVRSVCRIPVIRKKWYGWCFSTRTKNNRESALDLVDTCRPLARSR